jgi:hypothetical protein
MTTGGHAPVVVAGEPEDSLLARLIQGVGGPIMPPAGGLSEHELRNILDWIAAGAKND